MSTQPPLEGFGPNTTHAMNGASLQFNNGNSYPAAASELLEVSTVSSGEAVAKGLTDISDTILESAERPLPAAPLQAENDFYRKYRWCLNCFPSFEELTRHLVDELKRLDQVQNDWRRSEVITNIFLLSCTITDTIDDFLAGNVYDFSRIARVAPFASSAAQKVDMLVDLGTRVRSACHSRLRRWKDEWAAAVTEFLRHGNADSDRRVVSNLRARLAALLPGPFPASLWRRRPKLPAFFRSRDFAPADCLELGRKFVAAFPENDRPLVVLGLRTAGSFLAPLLSAYLSSQLRQADWLAVRPRKGLSRWERERLRAAAAQKARVLIIDESIHSGQTIAKTIDLLRLAGFSDESIVIFNPVEPAIPGWNNSNVFRCVSQIPVITLEPAERYKQRLLDSTSAVAQRLREYFEARGYSDVSVVASLKTKELNDNWRTAPERVDVRLKRVYRVHLVNRDGNKEVRYVLAKSVGWGWLSYHAFWAAEQLHEFVPTLLGLREGILYTEWFPSPQSSCDREIAINTLASYVAARARNLTLQSDPAPELAAEGRHRGLQILARALGQAYSSRIVAAVKRPRIQRELARQNARAAVLTDGKMSQAEWIGVDSRLLKTDFEHHGQGKNELMMTDPAYDLADALFHFGLSERESAKLVKSYSQQSGDSTVEQRLFFHKLLAGMWAQDQAILGLQNPKLLNQRKKFHEQYIAAWNFLIRESIRECGNLCYLPAAVQWRSPLVVTDIDGVLDRMVFGFPSTTAAGIEAISLLHSHGFAIAANTARTLQEVKQYCASYGFVGGVAEYGAVCWDALTDREIVLVSDESREQLDDVRKAFLRIPGVFLNDDYRYSLRVFTYQNGRTAPVTPLLVQDLLGSLTTDRLQVHHTGLDTAIIARETSKGSGLLALLDAVGHTGCETLAIGDSEPDLSMFAVARRSFAPGHISCRREAELVRCCIADRAYQPGLLQLVRQIVHPNGETCDRCRTARRSLSAAKGLLVSLLKAADEKPGSLLLRNGIDPSLVRLFRKN